MQIRDRIKSLRRVPAANLKANPKAWRRHGEQQRSALLGLLQEIGYVGALIARELPDGTLEILDGHLRAETTPDQKVPVLILDLDDVEADKVLATFDPLGAMAETDRVALAALIHGLEFETEAVQTMLNELVTEAGMDAFDSRPDGDADFVPDPPDKATTKRGDIWLLGDHRLMCGDSACAEDLDRLLAGERVHLVNTDPPYNVNVEPRSNNAIAAAGKGRKHHQKADLARHPEKTKANAGKLRAKDRPLANDFVTEEEFDRLLDAWFGNIARVLEPGRGFYIWGGYANCANYPPFLKKHELYFSQAVIWVKEHPVLTRKDFMGNHEWCFYGWLRGKAHYFNPSIKNATDVWSVKKVSPQKMVHLTEKPVELATLAIGYSSKPKENVLDLFGGSGSTLIGCEQTGRRARLMELDPLYCDVIVERWQSFTGRKAELAKAA